MSADAAQDAPERIKLRENRHPTVRQRLGIVTGHVRYQEARRKWPDAGTHQIYKVYRKADDGFGYYLGVVYRSRSQDKQGKPDSWRWVLPDGSFGMARSETDALEKLVSQTP